MTRVFNKLLLFIVYIWYNNHVRGITMDAKLEALLVAERLNGRQIRKVEEGHYALKTDYFIVVDKEIHIYHGRIVVEVMTWQTGYDLANYIDKNYQIPIWIDKLENGNHKVEIRTLNRDKIIKVLNFLM
jgi:hypothetical protein